jgi:HEAT repeat protein
MHRMDRGVRTTHTRVKPAHTATVALSFAVLGALYCGAAEPEPSSAPARQHTDPLGRPLPWGETAGGRRASASMLSTRLLYGQPIEARVLVPNDDRKPPYVPGVFTETGNCATAELTDQFGRSVAHEVLRRGGSHGTSGTDVRIRIRPKSAHGPGRYLRPGRYRLRVVVRCEHNPAIPKGWVGTMASNTLSLEVLPAAPPDVRAPMPEASRRRAEALVRQLGDRRAATRQAAQNALEAMGPGALAVLEAAAASTDLEVSLRAGAAIWKVVSPAVTLAHVPPIAGAEPVGYAVAGLSEASWGLVRDSAPPHLYEELRALAVQYGPLGPHVEMDPPSPAVVRRVLAGLADDDPLQRLRTLRGISRTSDSAILNAVLARLADTYSYRPSNVFDSAAMRTYPVRDCARQTLRWLGARAVPCLVEALRKHPDDKSPLRRLAMELLRQAGPDDRTLALCRSELERAGPSAAVISTLGACGPKAAPLLARIAPKAGPDLLQKVLRALADIGDARAAEPVVRDALGSDAGEVVMEACAAAGRLGLRSHLPRILAFCRRKGVDFNHRRVAMAAVCRLAPPEQAGLLMLELTAEGVDEAVRAEAATLLGTLEHRPALPRLLELLEDESGLIRSRADESLRVLARKPAGIGFDDNVYKTVSPDARRSEAEKWRRRLPAATGP